MQKKEYYDNNKVKLLLQRKEYYNNNKDLFIDRNNIYRDEHKAEASEYMKQYREDNKEIIKERRPKIIICECGRQISHWSNANHMKSKIHQQLMNELSLNSSATFSD